MFSILVVEDDETLNKMMCTKLKQENFKTFSAFGNCRTGGKVNGTGI